MNHDSESTFEPNGGFDTNPFGDPRTVPTGWDTSALYTLEREHRSAAFAMPTHSSTFMSMNNEISSDALS